MKRASSKSRLLKYSLVLVWGIFTISLTIWWYLYSLQLLEKISALNIAEASELARSHHMLFWEGTVLILCLLGGSIALGYSIFREARRSQRMRNFFLTFSHELKTPLASLRLQAESLAEDLQDTSQHELAQRIVADTSRLSARLENSLFLAQLNKSELMLEAIALESFIESLQLKWPNIEIDSKVSGSILADQRALESIFSNLIQNSLIHGQASRIEIKSTLGDQTIALELHDNGQGFQGRADKLSRAFYRHYSGSGTGIGLYLCRKLSRLMGGDISFIPESSGFLTRLTLQRASA